jgi:hypothetical protein
LRANRPEGNATRSTAVVSGSSTSTKKVVLSSRENSTSCFNCDLENGVVPDFIKWSSEGGFSYIWMKQETIVVKPAPTQVRAGLVASG